MRNYYHVCPYCGAHLDPGEKCDCGGEIDIPAAAKICGNEEGTPAENTKRTQNERAQHENSSRKGGTGSAYKAIH